MVRRVIFLCAAVLAAVLLRANAAACTVIAPAPPLPVPIELPSTGTSVVVSDYDDRWFAADELRVQLALVGVPADGVGHWICGWPPLVHGDLHDITADDLHSITRVLGNTGIPTTAITSVMTHPAPSPWLHKALPVSLGELLVAVRPMTSQSVDDLLSKIKTAQQEQPGLLVAGLVMKQRSCADRALALADVRAKALSDARSFASEFGSNVQRAVTDRFDLHPPGNESLMTCGDERPALPYFSQQDIREAAGNPRYHTHYFGRAVFAVSDMPRGAGSPIAHLREWGVVPTVPDDQVFPGALRVAPREPFVSTFGSYRAAVHADALMLQVSTYNAALFPNAADQSTQALLHIGIPRRDILVRNGVLFARVWPFSNEVLAQISSALAPIDGIDYGLRPFVRDCSTVRSQVAQHALHQALLRAKAMAAGARETTGRLITIDRGEIASDAACGADEHTPVSKLANMQPDEHLEIFTYPFDTNAEFVASVAAAWRLERAAPDTSTKPYSREDYGDVFLPAHGGPLGISSATFVAAKPQDCAARELPLLKAAVRNGLRQIDASGAFALVDQDFEFPSLQFSQCSLTRERAKAERQTVMQARVVVVP